MCRMGNLKKVHLNKGMEAFRFFVLRKAFCVGCPTGLGLGTFLHCVFLLGERELIDRDGGL